MELALEVSFLPDSYSPGRATAGAIARRCPGSRCYSSSISSLPASPLPRTGVSSPFLLPRQNGPHRRFLRVPPPPHCQKMFVPGFGEASPEAKAARNLHDFFTFVAVNIVRAQLESYNHEAYEELMEFISRNSLNDGDKFCKSLMRESPRHKGLALRILEVRSAYSKMDFEWDNLKKIAFRMVDESNTRLMRDYVLETSHMENEE